MGKPKSKLTPEVLAGLLRDTYFNKEELNSRYKEFMRDYPNGKLNKEQFNDFQRRFFPHGEPGQFVDYFFSYLDSNNDSEISFKEFICHLSLTLRGNPDEKLQWTFQLYDINRDGTIAYDELLQVVQSVYKLVGHTVPLPEDEDTPAKRVDKIFKGMDKNNDQKLTYAEFVNGCKRDPAIAKALTLYGGFA